MTKEEFYARYDVGNNIVRNYPFTDKDEGIAGWHLYAHLQQQEHMDKLRSLLKEQGKTDSADLSWPSGYQNHLYSCFRVSIASFTAEQADRLDEVMLQWQLYRELIQ